MLVTACLTLLASSLTPEDPKELQPSPSAKAHAVHKWQTKGGLRYTWVLPKGYDGKKPVALSVICHGTGCDYRWGHWNNKPGVFRPDDVVVSLDGTSPGPNDSRLFLGEPRDAKAFREALTELRATFAIDRVFLYGHSQGGFFVVYFAGEHPDAVQGVVAHASGAWNWSKTGKNVHKVAIAFLHGTMDPVVPYGQSPGSRDAYREAGVPLLHLRRLQDYNHWPNAVRATECLAWCDGMTTADPAVALRAAEAILEKKKPDEYQWETVVGFGAARQVLGRITGDEKPAFADAGAETRAAAQKLIDRIEAHGSKHVEALRKQLAKKADLVLERPAPWLGHLVALREDFRGVRSVEAFVKALEYDAVRKAQEKACAAAVKAWHDEQAKEVDKVKAVLANVARSFLCEGFPPELVAKLGEWPDAYKKHLGKTELADAAKCAHWRKGWKDGQEAYAKLWKEWK
jgi:predicted esterase